jgi:hypothetical protein
MSYERGESAALGIRISSLLFKTYPREKRLELKTPITNLVESTQN